MSTFWKALENWLHVQKKNRLMRRIALVLSCVVIFTTTYALILPAITMDLDGVEEVEGLFLEDAGDKSVLEEVGEANEGAFYNNSSDLVETDSEELLLDLEEAELGGFEETWAEGEPESVPDESEPEAVNESEQEEESASERTPESREEEQETEWSHETEGLEEEPTVEVEEAETSTENLNESEEEMVVAEEETVSKEEESTVAEEETVSEEKETTAAEEETETPEEPTHPEAETEKSEEETNADEQAIILTTKRDDLQIHWLFKEGVRLPEGAALLLREIRQDDPLYEEYQKAAYSITGREAVELELDAEEADVEAAQLNGDDPNENAWEEESELTLSEEEGEVTLWFVEDSAALAGEQEIADKKVPAPMLRFFEVRLIGLDGTELELDTVNAELLIQNSKLYLGRAYIDETRWETGELYLYRNVAGEMTDSYALETIEIKDAYTNLEKEWAAEDKKADEHNSNPEENGNERSKDLQKGERTLHVQLSLQDLMSLHVLGVEYQQEAEPRENSETAKAQNAGEQKGASEETLIASGADYTVRMTYTAAAGIPEGAVLKAAEISKDSEEYADYLASARKALGLSEDEAVPAYAARFFDITIYDTEGNPVEPKAAVKVEIQLAEKADNSRELQVVHEHAEEGMVAVGDVETKTEEGGHVSAVFEADSFSVYGVFYTQITTYVMSGKGEYYEVTVTYEESAGIPAQSSLRVTEFSYDSDEYLEALRKIVEYKKLAEPDFSEIGMGFEAFDISILDPNGNEVEPMTSVQVSITRKNFMGDEGGKSFLETAEVQHIIEGEDEDRVHVVAGASEGVDGSIALIDGAVVASFTVDHFSTYTISWGGGLSGQSIQSIITGDYVIYARDARNEKYYALVPSTSTNMDLSSVELTNNNGIISYDGNTDLYWHVTVNGTGNNRTFTMSYRSGYNTYYAYPVNANLYDGYTSNLRVRTNSYTWSNWANHIFCAGDTFMRSYNGTFQVWNQNDGNWQNMTNVFFAKVADVQNIKVHYGYMDGNTFKEFDELPEGAKTSYGAPSMIGDQLNVRYDISGKDYVTTRLNDPVNGTQISPLLQTEANSAAYWKYRVLNTVSENGGINEWQQFGRNDKDLYVIYRDTPTQKSYDTGDISPEDLEAPIATKNFERNGDGTYDLILGVTGKSNQDQQKTHANIVIVLDTSSSMYYTYSENPRTELGYTRLSAAKAALCDLADQLFGMNTEDDPAAIELAFVNFSHRVRNEQTMQQIYSGTDAGSFKSMINATNGNGGTNYDTAIEAANSILWNDADPTYVVFVTDGDTVSRGYLKYDDNSDGSDHASDWDGGTYYNGDTAHYGDTYLERARDAAKIQVTKVLNSGKKFYSIGVFGNVEHLGTMGGEYLGQANDKKAIEDAFSKIISLIKLDLGYKDVVINDGLTALTSSTIEHGSAGNFTYYRSGGSLGNGTEKYSSTANNGRGELWDIEGTDKEAFFLEIKDADTFYKNGEKWTNISAEQKAAYVDKYGVGSRTVVWDLGSDMLENGVTYKVAFTIWPSQEAYDLIADLNNGTVQFDKLDDSVKAQIVENNGVYYVKTNTKATVDYTSVRTENGVVTDQKTGSETIKDPEGKMNLDTNIVTVRKEFAHLINESDPYEKIVFYLLVDGKYYNKDGSLSDTLDESKVYAINLPKDGEWEDQIYIAPGLMRGGDILETGHNYSLVEKIISGNPYEYEFASQTLRPMVITAVPTFLVRKDDFNKNEENKKEYTFVDEEGTYTEVGGQSDEAGTYYAESENDGSLVGVNHKTSELDITKIIHDPDNLIDDAQETAETFTYRVTLQIPDGCDPSGIVGYEYVPRTQSNAFTLFGYQTGQSAFAEDIERFHDKTYRAWNTLVYDALIEYDRITENGRTFIKARRDDNGNIIWKIPAEGGYHTITYDMTLKQDEVIRFTNLPTGTKYTIQEIYANRYPADNVGGKTDGRTPVSDASNLAAEGYEIERVQHSGGTLSADKTTVEGTIGAPDTRYYNQFTNKKVKEDKTVHAELKVKKEVEEYTWGSEYYRFTLKAGTGEYTDAEGGSGNSPMPENEKDSAVSIYDTTQDHTLSFGTIRYTRPGNYTYTISEYDNTKNMPYVQFASPVNLTVTVTADEDGNLTVSEIKDEEETTVFSAETGTALATGLTTRTNTVKTIHIRKVEKYNSNTVLAGGLFEIRRGGVQMYLQNGKLLDAAVVEEIIGMSVSAGGADDAMAAKNIDARFTLGEIDISGFSYDEVYELKEIQAPDGYIIISSSTYFKAVHENAKTYVRLTDQSGTILTDDNSEAVLDSNSATVAENGLFLSIKNEPGVALPSTGGSGTELFYFFGTVLTCLAGAGLVMKRRRRNVA